MGRVSAVVLPNGTVRQLDRQAEPEEHVQSSDVSDASTLTRLLMRILRDIARMKRRWLPANVAHRGRVVDATGTVLHRFPHGFGGLVNWWPKRWVGAAGPQFSEHASSDADTLVLVSYVAGTVTLYVEEAG